MDAIGRRANPEHEVGGIKWESNALRLENSGALLAFWLILLC
jgi:hypothetical protein